jgi:RHS repeat-associated protein
MRYFLLFLALFLQLNASGYTDYNPQKNCAQKKPTAESSENNERSFVLFRYQGQYEDAETGLYYNRFRYYSPEEGVYLSQDPIRLAANSQCYSYVNDTNGWIDPLGLEPLVPGAPTYSGVYRIVGADGKTYVGSALNINTRLDSTSHPTVADIINTGDYTIDFYEVDMGTQKVDAPDAEWEIQNHILRHHEQQIMDKYGYEPGINGNKNKNNPEAKGKKVRNAAEVEIYNAHFTGKSETGKYQGGSLCSG